MAKPSDRLKAIVDALPLQPNSRVLEIGCGPGVAARLVATRIPEGHILAIDRSGTAVAQALKACAAEVASGRLSIRQEAAESFRRRSGEGPFDIIFAVRVGCLDGRHPEKGRIALERLKRALAPGGRIFIDGGDPLRDITPSSA